MGEFHWPEGGIYQSHCYLTDFYPGNEKLLRETLVSGMDFDTGWFSCKKEIGDGMITRDGGKIIIKARAIMDDLYEGDDLIYDALWETVKSEEELPDEIISRIRDVAIDEGICECTIVERTLPADASYDDVVKALDEAVNESDKENDKMYKRLCEIVKAHYEYWKGEKSNRHE